jgi:glycosyltransferase involved in cell wall biosynthesis
VTGAVLRGARLTPRPRRPIRVLELRSVRGTGGGPEKTILLGAARSDPQRVQTTVCYLRDSRDEIFSIDARARELGVEYFEIRESHSFDLSAWFAIRRIVRDRHIDIVHAHEYKTDLIAAYLGRTTEAIPLATAHGWTGHSGRERFVYYPADRLLLSTFPALIAVSSEIRAALIRAGAPPERVTTVLNGIDPQAFRRNRSQEVEARRALGFERDTVVIGSVGRLEPQKRFDLLIEAVARLGTARPALRLVIAGDGSLRHELEARARQWLPRGSYRFLGHCSDIAGLHHAFDVFVQSSDYEGTPNAVLEAMALETPVVATDAGGTAEVIEHGVHGLITPRGDVTALTTAIHRMLGDPEMMAGWAAAARRRVEQRLSFDGRMRSVERIYEQLMEGRPRWACAQPVQTE